MNHGLRICSRAGRPWRTPWKLLVCCFFFFFSCSWRLGWGWLLDLVPRRLVVSEMALSWRRRLSSRSRSVVSGGDGVAFSGWALSASTSATSSPTFL